MHTRSSPPLPSPVSFNGCAGWLHRGSSTRGVVLCGAQGFEGLCAYQSWRVFADLIAAEGASALRFDYPGEGDSLDREGPPVAGWLQSVHDAIGWMRHEAGLTDIVVVGLRFGAVLALKALENEPRVSGLALMSPAPSGATYLRECRAVARLFAENRLGSGVDDEGVSICGHKLEASAFDAMKALSVPAFAHSPAARILFANPSDRTESALVTQLSGLGAPVTLLPFEGYTGMIAPPTAAITPFAELQRIAAWIGEGATAAKAPQPAAALPLARGPFRERRVIFGADRTLAGVLCEPLHHAPGSSTVLMLNAGANNHFGWARMNVRQARALAADGIASLRMDATGIGDSVWSEDGPRPLLYSRRQIADVSAAIDFLEAEGHRSVTPVGACAGGFAAFHAAHDDQRIESAISVNVLRLLWHAHDDLDTAEAALNQSSAAYAERAFSGAAWKRILTGDVSPRRVLSILRLLAGKAASKFIEPLAEKIGVDFRASPDAQEVRAMFRAMSRRGVRLTMAYADKDAGRDEIDRHMGADARIARGLRGVTIEIIPDADHELTPAAAQDQLLALMRKAALPA